MRPRITFEDPNQQGVRDHYCLELRQVVGLRVEALPRATDVFCPLCGIIVTTEFVQHRYEGAIHVESYRGSRCEHGYPDRSCTDLEHDFPEAGVALAARSSIREYAAAELAARYGGFPEVLDWVRACPVCRRDRALANRPLLTYALGVIAKRVAHDLRELHREREELVQASTDLQGAIRALEGLREDAGDLQASPKRGFVYLISRGDAAKIGFSEKHPRLSRLPELQVASPEELSLVGLVYGSTRDERELHRRFQAHHVRGEWFRLSEEIIHYFRENGLSL